MTISRTELSKAFRFNAPSLTLPLPQSNPQETISLFRNKNAALLNEYKNMACKLTCYQAKTGETYVLLSVPSFGWRSRAFTVDTKDGTAREIFSDSSPIVKLAKLKGFLEQITSGRLQTCLTDAVRKITETRLSGSYADLPDPSPGESVPSLLNYIETEGSAKLSSLAQDVCAANESNESSLELRRNISTEITSLLQVKENRLSGEIKKIESNYDSVSVPLGDL